MSTPIGSIEFLVKFDTMSDSFKDAMKEAMEDADLDLDTDDLDEMKRDIQWLRWNIATRMRLPMSVDYDVSRLNAPAHMNWAQDPETVKRLAAEIINWEGGVPLIPREEGEDEGVYRDRVKIAAKIILDQYAGELGQMMDPELGKELFLTNPKRFIHITNMIQEAIDGTWSFVIKDAIEKLFPETMIKAASAVILRGGGATVWEREKHLSDVITEFGRGGAGREISSAATFMEAMRREQISQEAVEDIFSMKPSDYKKAGVDLKAFAKTLYDDYTIKVGAQLPNIILRLIQQEAVDIDAEDIEKFWGLTGQRMDIFGIVLKENKDEFYTLLRDRLREEEAEEFIDTMEHFFETEGGEVFPFGQELKTYITAAKAAREVKIGKDPKGLRGAAFGGGAPYLMNVLDALKTTPIPELKKMMMKEGFMDKNIMELLKLISLGLNSQGDNMNENFKDVKEAIAGMDITGIDDKV